MQRYSGLPELHCVGNDREDQFGKEKFHDRWIGPQSKDELALLEQVRDRNRDWMTLKWNSERQLPDYICLPDNPAVSRALDRALSRARMLVEVREDLSLLDSGLCPVARDGTVNIEKHRRLDQAGKIDLRVGITEVIDDLKAETHKRPADIEIEKVLKKHDYHKGPKGKTNFKIAGEIQTDFNQGKKIQKTIDAISKEIGRYYGYRGIPVVKRQRRAASAT